MVVLFVGLALGVVCGNARGDFGRVEFFFCSFICLC